MKRFGIFCFLGRGHLDPAIAIGRGLLRRGHQATVFHLGIAEAAVRAAGLGFQAIDTQEPPSLPKTGAVTTGWRSTLAAIGAQACRTLREGPAAVRANAVEVVIGDQLDVAAGTVAESMGLPHLTLSCAPPTYFDENVPPPYFGWQPGVDAQSRRKNARANSLLERVMEPVLDLLNRQRRLWALPGVAHVHDLFSKRAIISQLPRFLEFPRAVPEHLHYTAQFRDACVEKSVRFDWSRLSGRRLVFASMGTIRNTSLPIFRTIVDACAQFEVQLVLSLGGVHLSSLDLGPLPPETVVVPYAPQRALLERAVLAVNCAGLNTTLECLRNGVPMVALPAGEDQPGVAARLARAKAGIVIPTRFISAQKLTAAIRELLEDGPYRRAAAAVARQLQRMNGVEDAIDLIEKAA